MDPRAELIAQRIAEMVADLPASVAEELVGHLQSLGATPGDRVASDPPPPGFPADCRDGVDALVAAWRSSGSSVSAHALGLAILSASRAAEAERLGERVELVWSGPAKPGTALRRTEQALTELVQSARSELWIVSYVAYSVSGLRDALADALRRGVRVCLLLESRESGGGRITHDGIAALRPVVDLGAVVYEWPIDRRPTSGRGSPGSLHAKFALADASMLFVTSANLTEAAFDINMELGVLVRGGPTPARVAAELRWLVDAKQIIDIGASRDR
jgi:cardiolipin synthase